MFVTFEVYTYFGRVISRHEVRDDEIYYSVFDEATDDARAFAVEHDQPAWVRIV